MLKKIILLISLISFPVWCRGIPLKINGKTIEENTILNLFSEDLKDGEILFFLNKEPQVTKVEISLDRGRTWEVMTEEEEAFIFKYHPFLKQEELIPIFLISYKNQGSKTYNPFIKIYYQKEKPEKAILTFLEKMKLFYEQEQKNRFLNLFSSKFPDRIKFEQAIQDDFYNYNNIRLFYRIDRKVFNPDYNLAILDVYWKRKYDTRTGSSRSDEAKITMQLAKEGPNWKIIGLKNNTIFGSSLIASPDLKISDSDLSGTTGPNGYLQVTAIVHNNGKGSASNVKVSFYYKSGSNWYLDGSETISSIDSRSQVSVSHEYINGLILYGIPTDIKVVVDPDNTITETNEVNNTAKGSF